MIKRENKRMNRYQQVLKLCSRFSNFNGQMFNMYQIPFTYLSSTLQVCEKKKILKEQKTAEYIMREKDILATITEHLKGDSRVPFFVKLHSTFQVLNFDCFYS